MRIRSGTGRGLAAALGAALVAALVAACGGRPMTDASVAMETAASGAAATGPIIGEVSPPRERARAHTDLAAAYYERGSMGIALEELRIALAADPNYAPAYNVLGLVHMDLKEFPQAEQSFERAVRIAPNDPDINHNFGWFLCQTGREDQSFRYFLAAIKNPLYATPQKSYALAGTCAVRKGRDSDARDFYERALRLDRNFPPALVGLAQLKFRSGELRDAHDLISRFNQLVEPTAESVWLALLIERKLGDRTAEAGHAAELRRRFAGSAEYQNLLRGRFE
jgi:type IV pilus assembly protein PilF